jgi:hypothetical protein
MNITPLDHFPFEFYDDIFTAILANDRKLYVSLHDMCLSLGIQTNGQIRRIRENEAIADALIPLTISRAYQDEGVQTREMLCLRLDRLPYWLGTLQPGRIGDVDKRARVVRFQREFADVAWAAFRGQILLEEMRAELDASLPPAQQEYLRLMDEAATLRQGMSQQGQRLDSLEQRIATVEARIVGTDYINTAQMKEYTDMVGILAHLMKQKGKGNEATVHAEVKRQFQVPSYQLIPEASFDQVKRYLRDWYRRLAGPAAAIPALFEQPSQRRLL